MKTIDDMLDEIGEDRPQDLHEDEVVQLHTPDEEDLEDIIQDCYVLLSELQHVKLNKALTKEIARLHSALEEIIGWNTIH